MNRTADVIIVGGGVTGLSTALQLRERGVERVTVLERDYVGAAQSGRAAGVARVLVADPRVAQWQLDAQRFFSGFTERFGVPVEVHRHGYLLVARAEDEARVLRSVEVARQVGVDARRIDAAEALEVQLGVRQDDSCIYVFESGALYVDPMPVTHALATAARSRGVDICEACDVREVLVDGDQVTGVRTAAGDHPAPSVMIATSVWGRAQLERMRIDVPVYPHRAEMGFFHAPLGSSHQLSCILSDVEACLYLRPEGERQMFVGWREGDLVDGPDDYIAEDPDRYRQTALPERVHDMHARLAAALPFMKDGFVHRTYACVYDYTPDGQPILDADGPRGLYYALGFSGGGFSSAPTVGRTMAQFIVDEKKPEELHWLRRSRFEDGELITWSN